jgi:hypothetical protein
MLPERLLDPQPAAREAGQSAGPVGGLIITLLALMLLLLV